MKYDKNGNKFPDGWPLAEEIITDADYPPVPPPECYLCGWPAGASGADHCECSALPGDALAQMDAPHDDSADFAPEPGGAGIRYDVEPGDEL